MSDVIHGKDLCTHRVEVTMKSGKYYNMDRKNINEAMGIYNAILIALDGMYGRIGTLSLTGVTSSSRGVFDYKMLHKSDILDVDVKELI